MSAIVPTTGLHLRTLGEPALLRDGVELPLPASRKTRALLVLLLLSTRPWRREQLCELFWDVPNDPRAALRWSLTKIRHLLGDQADALEATRDHVQIRPGAVAIDQAQLAALDRETDEAVLFAWAERAIEPPLLGLDLPQLSGYSAWLTGARLAADALRATVLRTAAARPGIARDRAHRFLSAAVAAAPGDAVLPSRPGAPAAVVAVANPAVVAAADAPAGRHLPVRYLTSADGVRIAHTSSGTGPVLVKTANWLNHLELDWDSPLWGRLFRELSQQRRLVRYDERGNGLSQWEVEDISLEAFVRDLEAVVDGLGLERFPLLGISQGCAVSIEYAARHPQRVSRLVLVGGYAAGWRATGDARLCAEREATITLVRQGWGRDNPAYRQIFSHSFFPSGSAAELDWFSDFQRRCTSAENAARFLQAFGDIDVRDRLARIAAPTLVLHSRGDQRIPLQNGMELAAGIANASLVTLDSDSHLPLDREPAHRRMADAIADFLAADD